MQWSEDSVCFQCMNCRFPTKLFKVWLATVKGHVRFDNPLYKTCFPLFLFNATCRESFINLQLYRNTQCWIIFTFIGLSRGCQQKLPVFLPLVRTALWSGSAIGGDLKDTAYWSHHHNMQLKWKGPSIYDVHKKIRFLTPSLCPHGPDPPCECPNMVDLKYTQLSWIGFYNDLPNLKLKFDYNDCNLFKLYY